MFRISRKQSDQFAKITSEMNWLNGEIHKIMNNYSLKDGINPFYESCKDELSQLIKLQQSYIKNNNGTKLVQGINTLIKIITQANKKTIKAINKLEKEKLSLNSLSVVQTQARKENLKALLIRTIASIDQQQTINIINKTP